MKKSLSTLGLILVLAAPAWGQVYFGQNKIQYTDFDWQVLKGEHVDVYYYPEEEDIARVALSYAEDSFALLEQRFRHHPFRPQVGHGDHGPFVLHEGEGGPGRPDERVGADVQRHPEALPGGVNEAAGQLLDHRGVAMPCIQKRNAERPVGYGKQGKRDKHRKDGNREEFFIP